MNLFLCAGGGFLIAVLWMDLMFDVLTLGASGRDRTGGSSGESIPEDRLAQIAAYYRRVTTTAAPMNLLISAVMAGMVAVLVMILVHGHEARTVSIASLALCAVPIVLALLRVFPHAVRLGSRSDSPPEQSRLARAIFRDHVMCLAAMLAFVGLRFAAAG